MIFNKFDHPIAVKIHADQDLENVSLSGNLGSTILMNQKTYHGKPTIGVMWHNSFKALHLRIVLTTLFWEIRYTHREFRSSL